MCNDTTTTQLFCCDCGQNEHLMMVDHYHWGDGFDATFSIRIYLNQNKRFLQRLKIAALYLIGRKSKHGAFDSLILGNGDVRRLRNSCNTFMKTVAREETKKEQSQ